MIIRLDGGLFFATSDTLEDRLRQVIHTTPDLTGIVLDCEGINFVDSQGAAKLMEMVELAEESGITLRLARLKTSVRPTLKRDGVFARFGPDRIHGNVFRAVQAQLAADPRRGPAGLTKRVLSRSTTRSARSARGVRRAAGRGR